LFEFFFKYSPTTFERSEFVFASGWPVWLLAVLGVLAVVAVGVSIARQRALLTPPQTATLGVLQALTIVGALLLAWRPALQTETLRAEDNVVALVLDTSASMSQAEGEQSRLQQSIAALEAGALDTLDDTFELRIYAFAEDSQPIESLAQVPAPGPVTRIGDALLNVLREARSAPLGAVVLVSDGGDNSRRLDAPRLAEIAGFGVPVHTVGVGREHIAEDRELVDVEVAAQGVAGSTVSAQVSIRHAAGGTASLKVYDGDAIVASEEISLPEQAGVTTRWIDLDLGAAGIRDLRFTLDPMAGERNVVNNTQFRPIEVPASRRSILYIEGEPRWEYKFIRRALDKTSPVRLASLLRTTPNKFYRQGVESPEELTDGFPATEEALFAYDALMIGSFEAAALSAAQLQTIHDFVSRRGGSLLMLGGRRGLADGGWGNTIVAEAIPARLPKVEAPSFMRWPAKASVTADGADSLLTRLDADAAVNQARWQELPELADFQYLDGLKAGAVTLLEAEIRGRTEPLLVHQRYGLGNAYVLASGGTWRWQMQLPHEDLRHETFWRQLLQALATAAPAQVTLAADRPFYGDENLVALRAEVRDRSFNPAHGANLKVSVSTGLSPAESIEMVEVAGQPGVYEASYDAAAPGIYRFEATAALGEESLGSARVAVRRQDGIAEHFQIEQNRPLLERVAAATGGRYFGLDELATLPEAIRFSEAGIVEREILELWNMPINFLVLLLLKGGEWLLRLRWGRL
jgi:uncharacterized membrane protein